MTHPRVSVIMPVYNGERYLAEAIDSVINQTYEDWELIVVDDGSLDASVSIVESYEDLRIRLIKNPQNVGVAKSLNRAIEASNGQYIARMDSDDICMPDRLQTQVSYLRQNPDVMLVGSSVIFLGEKAGVFRYPLSDDDIRVQLHFNSSFAHPTVMWRSDFAAENGLRYQEDPPTAEDYQLWVEFCALAPVANIAKPLLKYRVDTSIKISNYLKQQHAGGREIREGFLKKLTDFSDTDIYLHHAVCEGQYAELTDQLDEILSWLERLQRALIQSGQFESKAVSNIIQSYTYISAYSLIHELSVGALLKLPISCTRKGLLLARKAGLR